MKEKNTKTATQETPKTFPWPVKIPPAPQNAELPVFEYYTDPVGNKSITEKNERCDCCEMERNFIYIGPIYTRYGSPRICPWCIHNGRAAEMWDASFQDRMIKSGNTKKTTLESKIYEKVMRRTPGYSSWQGNDWLFSDTDAMVFVGEAVGKDLLAENNPRKISAVLSTINEIDDEWTKEDLKSLVHGGQPSVYIFFDRDNESYHCYQDFT